jgi:hypothetical protein
MNSLESLVDDKAKTTKSKRQLYGALILASNYAGRALEMLERHYDSKNDIYKFQAEQLIYSTAKWMMTAITVSENRGNLTDPGLVEVKKELKVLYNASLSLNNETAVEHAIECLAELPGSCAYITELK